MLLRANKERAVQFLNMTVFGEAFSTLSLLDKPAGRSG